MTLHNSKSVSFIKHTVFVPGFDAGSAALMPEVHDATTPDTIIPASDWKKGEALFLKKDVAGARMAGFMGRGLSKIAIKVSTVHKTLKA